MVFALLTLTNCSTCKPERVYIDKPIEVKIPIKCIVPNAQCDFNKTTDTEVITSLLTCIINMKKNEEVCK